MRRLLIWIVVPIGLLVGYTSMAYVQRPTDRPTAAIELFSSYCVPYVMGDSTARLSKLEPLETGDRSNLWADPASAIVVSFRKSGCSVTDELKHFTLQERITFEALATTFVQESFPDLSPEDSNLNWDFFKLWSKHSIDDPKRRAVFLYRFSNEMNGPDSTTLFSIGGAFE